MDHFCIARQAICDETLQLVGYELLYRANSEDISAIISNPHEATARVTSLALLDFGLDHVASKQPIYINMSSEWFKHPELLPSAKIRQRIVLQVPTDIVVDETLCSNLQRIRAKGFLIALDDYKLNDPRTSLLTVVDIVIVETLNQSLSTIRKVKTSLLQYPVKTLAEKIENWTNFEQLKQMGFDYYQGFFLARPENLAPQASGANQLILAKLMTLLFDESSSVEQIEHYISQEPALYYRLMKYVNSAMYNLPNSIDSMHQAVVYMGMETLRTVICILMWARNSNNVYTVLPLLLTRAKACELLARHHGMKPVDRSFTLGFLSLLDVALGQPLPKLLSNLPLSPDMSEALLHSKGSLAELLNCVRHWERAEWEALEAHPLYCAELPILMSKALDWANQTEDNMTEH
ncbi:EAL and modified HD-GYP domain-containing signal transduction protein [Oceanospirillum multiglobuliferum]|uniref:HDOD domain-containing protein n=1 Tax=Oceanospirillum multiglobuliferum TaxID=64969 RepID=A0A1T4M4L7_9GAMM|nr:HDOD domain-containing protein [Oceanospirillum multiglobuliferum]OPX56246.1 hypothetical protein BTE48_04530 [Oceanospirillum multiglobuliferum]SJZ61950.1 EAL and modified HD-GYP domain-containing signal transduction protein [Oceanospirillum multiglobuliferum]